MVKIALDPAMYHATMSVADELRKAADLGYEYLELSPRADWFFWHRYPKADNAMIAEVNKAVKETGVRISSLVPVFGWSAPDEQERQAQVRNWKRLLEIADGLDGPVIMTELAGDPSQPLKSEHAFYHSMEELIPAFERYRLKLNIEAHPLRLLRAQRRRGADHPRAEPALDQLLLLHPARLPPVRRRRRHAHHDRVRRR